MAGRPFVNLTLALNYAVSGLNPWSYHLVNIGVHLLAGWLLFGIVRRTLERPRLANVWGAAARPLALVITALWLLHPLQTEAVTYVIQRTELLASLFILLALYAVIRSAATKEPRVWWAVAVLASILGAGCKETAVVIPVVVLVYDWLFLAGSIRGSLRERKPLYLGLALGWLVIGAWLLSHPRGRSVDHTVISPGQYALTQTEVIVHYLRLCVWPRPLVADYYDWPLATGLRTVWPAVTVIVALLVVTVTGLVRRRPWAFLGVMFFLVLAPSSSVIPIVTEIAAERRMYLPLAAVIAAVVLGSYRYRGRCGRWVGASGFGIALVVLSSLTIDRNQVYRDEQTFWSEVLEQRPGNARALTNLGNLHLRAGRLASAIDHFRRATAADPTLPEAHNNLGYAARKPVGPTSRRRPCCMRCDCVPTTRPPISTSRACSPRAGNSPRRFTINKSPRSWRPAIRPF